MQQTLLYIPASLFGSGWLLAAWAVLSVAWLAWLGRRQGFNADTWGYLPLLLVVGGVIRWLLPALCDAQGLPIRGYGVMLLLAIVASTGLAAWRAKSIGVDPEIALSLAFWLIVLGLVGARVFYVIEYWSSFRRPEYSYGDTLVAILSINQGGLVVYGSLLGGTLALALFVYRYRLPLGPMADLVAPCVLLGMSLGRIGCLLNGCCYGGPCSLPWAVTFPWGSPPHVHQVQHGEVYLHGLKLAGQWRDPAVISEVEPGSPAARVGLAPGQQIVEVNHDSVSTVEEAEKELLNQYKPYEPGTTLSIRTAGSPIARQWILSAPPARSLPVHPTQIYDAITCLLLCLLLLAYDPFRRRDGEVFALAITLYSIARFLLESIRRDEAPVFGTGMSISQNVSLAVLVAAAVLWWYVLRQPRRTRV